MKNQLLQLGKYLFLSGALLFLGCQAEEIAVEQQANSEKELILKKITFKEFRSNKNAFENFKKAQLKRSLASKNRGAYDESYGVFVDTSNIFVIERDGKHSITLQIESESDNSKIENLVLNSKDGGGYSAYIAEYQLSSQEQSVLLNGGALPGKTPSHITSLETSSRINIGGNGADCIDIIIRTVKMCHDANGNAQIDNGDLGNGCVGTFYELEVTTIMVDYECMAGGGGGGGNEGTGSPGSPNTGSPGNTGTIGGGGDSGGFGGGTPGPGNDGSPASDTGGNTGIPHNPDTSLTDGDGNPVLTTPILIVDRVRDFYRDLDAGQKAWWNNAENAVAVDVIKDYLRNSGNVDYSMDFGRDFIQATIETGLNLDFEKSLKSPMNVDLSAVSGNSPEEVKFKKVYEKLLLSPSFKNLFSNVFDRNDRVSVKFNITDASVMQNNLGQTTHLMVNNKLQINVTINKQLLLSQAPFDYGSNIFIAKVVAHECLHAFIQYVRINSLQHPNLPIANIDDMTFAEAIAEYYSIYGNNAEHDFIADKLIPELSTMLNEILTELIPQNEITTYSNTILDYPGAGINEPWNWNAFLENLSTQGLEDTKYFNTRFYTHLPGSEAVIQMISIQNTSRYFHYIRNAKLMSRIN